jgi:hypothetical protein
MTEQVDVEKIVATMRDHLDFPEIESVACLPRDRDRLKLGEITCRTEALLPDNMVFLLDVDRDPVGMIDLRKEELYLFDEELRAHYKRRLELQLQEIPEPESETVH